MGTERGRNHDDRLDYAGHNGHCLYPGVALVVGAQTEELVDISMTDAVEEVEDPADRKYFILTEEQWNTFWEMLESAIVKDNPRLRKLMAKKPIWEVPGE